jgi:hypothetical protein
MNVDYLTYLVPQNPLIASATTAFLSDTVRQRRGPAWLSLHFF